MSFGHHNSITERVVIEKMYDALDQLPPRLREMLIEAPYNYSAVEVLEAFHRLTRAGTDRDEAMSIIINNARAMFSHETAVRALAAYGPEHPQARGVDRRDLQDMNLLSTAEANNAWRLHWQQRHR